MTIRSILLAIFFCGVAQAAENDLRIWYTKPAGAWEEALPIGSGRMGAMVFGGIPDERIQFNEDTLWTGKPHDYVRDGASDVLEQLRELVFADKQKEAADLVRKSFLSDPVRQKAFQPFGDIRIHFTGQEDATDYRRELDLSSAIARVSYRAGGVAFSREVFASYPDNVIIVKLSTDQPGKLNCTIRLDSPHKNSQTRAADDHTLVLTGQVQDPVPPNDMGMKVESRLKVIPTGGAVSKKEDLIELKNVDSAVIELVAATDFKNWQELGADPAARCDAYLSKIKDKTFESIKTHHISDFRSLFDRVKIDLGRTDRADLPTDQRLKQINRAASAGPTTSKNDPLPTTLPASGLDSDPALAALFFQFGRYMLISSSRPGTQAANLQGVWNELLTPPWESKYTTNINLEMNYWPAEVTNLSECTGPLFDMIDDLVISGARTAQKQYHARGWVLHHNTDLWRGTAPINNIDGVWPTGGAWLCYHLWEHFLFTRDQEFLSKRAYPAMKQASLFFIDSLVKDPKTGFLVTNPSFSPEQGGLRAGPAMDMQIIRALFDATMESARILNVDAELVEQIKSTRVQLAPDKIGQHGQLQEWQEDVDQPNNNHRHLSPLFGLYPAAQFTPAAPKLFDAAKVLLKWRGDGSTGWSYAWRIPLWARVNDGEMAYRQLQLQMAKRTFANLFDKCGPFQVDGNFGATAGIAEMLLQSQIRICDQPPEHEIHLLPALPIAWPTGSVSGLCARGGYEVDFSWKDRKLDKVTIRSKLGNPCRLRLREKSIDLTTASGKSYRFDGSLNPIP